MFKEEPERYYRIALSALRSFVPRTSMYRVMKEYYPDLVKIPIVQLCCTPSKTVNKAMNTSNRNTKL